MLCFRRDMAELHDIISHFFHIRSYVWEFSFENFKWKFYSNKKKRFIYNIKCDVIKCDSFHIRIFFHIGSLLSHKPSKLQELWYFKDDPTLNISHNNGRHFPNGNFTNWPLLFSSSLFILHSWWIKFYCMEFASFYLIYFIRYKIIHYTYTHTHTRTAYVWNWCVKVFYFAHFIWLNLHFYWVEYGSVRWTYRWTNCKKNATKPVRPESNRMWQCERMRKL